MVTAAFKANAIHKRRRRTITLKKSKSFGSGLMDPHEEVLPEKHPLYVLSTIRQMKYRTLNSRDFTL